MSEAEVLISSRVSYFLFFMIQRKTQSKKNPRNLKPILILAESNNNNLRCLTLLNATPISVPLGNKMNKYIPQFHTDHNTYGLLS